jgi:hypothetical protein
MLLFGIEDGGGHESRNSGSLEKLRMSPGDLQPIVIWNWNLSPTSGTLEVDFPFPLPKSPGKSLVWSQPSETDVFFFETGGPQMLNPPASTSWMLGLQQWATRPSLPVWKSKQRTQAELLGLWPIELWAEYSFKPLSYLGVICQNSHRKLI